MSDLLTVDELLAGHGVRSTVAELSSAMDRFDAAGEHRDDVWGKIPIHVAEDLGFRSIDSWRALTAEALRSAEAHQVRCDTIQYGAAAAARIAAASTERELDTVLASLPARQVRASEQRELDRLEQSWRELLDLYDTTSRQIGDEPMTTRHGGIDADTNVRAGQAGGDGPEFRDWLRTGNDAELRALGTNVDSAGGYAVPESFRNRVTETMEAFGGVRRLAEIVATDTGQTMPWPTNDDTANEGDIAAENTEVTELDLTFGERELGAYMYTSRIVKVSFQLMEDAGVDIESLLARKLGQRIAKGQASDWITGSGTNEPQGLVTGTTVGVTAAAQTAVTYDELVDHVTSVDLAYRTGGEVGGDPDKVDPGVAWLMADATYNALRKLKDGDGRPLIDPDVRGGLPTTLLGYKIVLDNGMPAMAAGNSPIVFGNIRAAYVIRLVNALHLQRLDERYAEFLQVGFLAHQRADGLVQDPSAAKKLTMAA